MVMNKKIFLWIVLLFLFSCGKEESTSQNWTPHEMNYSWNVVQEGDFEEVDTAEKEFTQELNSLLQTLDESTD